ncbi:MAG: hypothetical protein VB092_06210 [Oscillospiraceae bacterium]|nr:hypothetical protein [Oscillospiraceae bacterium]
MKTIYTDSDFKCHVTAADGRTATETAAFDGKCDAYIKGFCFIPAGQTWTREDGVQFAGEMLSPWQNFAQLDAAQRAYEKGQYEAAIDELLLLIGGEGN